MTQLTQEVLEQLLDQKLAPLATKEDVHREVRSGVDELARITSAGFASVEERFNDLDVKAQLKAFERKFQKLEEALHIKL